MVNFTILAGGFTNFVATYVFDSDVGALTLIGQSPTGDSASWIASHPQNKSVLYAVNEIGPIGNLQSFIVDDQGALSLVDTVTTGGNGPTFTNPLSTGEVSAMNFGSPNASFISTDPSDPAIFVKDNLDLALVNFPVNGGPSNPHMSLEFNGEIFVPDLGADKIWRVVNNGGQFEVQGQIDVAPGSGPRHIAIRDNILFTINELTSTLTAQQIPQGPNGTTLPLLANVSIIPELAPGFNGSFFAAEILISEPSEAFPDPLIYVSNRNLGPDIDERGDSIAIFEFKGLANGTVNGTAAPGDSSSLVSTITLVAAAETSPAVNAKRMIKQHRRNAHDQVLRRVYDYPATPPNTTEPAAGSGTTITLVSSPSPTSPAAPGSIEAAPAEVTEGSLTLVNQVFTGLQQIRSFSIGSALDGGEEFLIAGANTVGGVAVFQRVNGGRNLTLVAQNAELQNRTSFVFV